MQSIELNVGMRECLNRAAGFAANYPRVNDSPSGLSLADLRACYRDTISLLGPAPILTQAPKDFTIELKGRSLAARFYVPDLPVSDTVLVYFHGGGWVVGDLDTHDHLVRYICKQLGASVVSLAYRLAPEHGAQAVCDDASDSLAWFHKNVERFNCLKVATAGDSAGAYLAAVTAGSLASIVCSTLLLYPVVARKFSTTSYMRRGGGPGLTAETMRWYWTQFSDQLPTEKALSFSIDLTSNTIADCVANATIVSAWHDPLYDEGRAYANFLTSKGARVSDLVAHDMPHGFARYWAVNSLAKAHLDRVLAAFSPSL
jgi:acetyl esterase